MEILMSRQINGLSQDCGNSSAMHWSYRSLVQSHRGTLTNIDSLWTPLKGQLNLSLSLALAHVNNYWKNQYCFNQ